MFFRIAANTFLAVGVLLGVVSLGGLLYFGSALLATAPPAASGGSPADGNVLILATHGLSKAVEFLSGIADGILKAFAAASATGLCVAVLLVQTGRGLKVGRRWAKVLALALLPVGFAFGFAAGSLLGVI